MGQQVKIAGMTGTAHDVAALTGLTIQRVHQLVKEGRIQQRARGEFDLVLAVSQYCEFIRGYSRGSDTKRLEDEERTRLTSAKADLAELEAAERHGQLVNRDAVRRQDAALARVLRNNLLTIPDRVTALLVAATEAGAVHKILADEIEASLEQVVERLGNIEVDAGELDVNRRTARAELEANQPGGVSRETAAAEAPQSPAGA